MANLDKRECRICRAVVACTHPMQTIRAQYMNHLRDNHKLTIRQANVEEQRRD